MMDKFFMDTIEIARLHLDRLKKAKEEIKARKVLENIENSDFVEKFNDDFEVIKLIDTFIFRFMKLQNYMGGKLFKAFLEKVGDYKEEMSFVDVLDRLEKLKIIDSTNTWLKLRKLRNKLAHEYPNEYQELVDDIKIAMGYVEYLEEVLERVMERGEIYY